MHSPITRAYQLMHEHHGHQAWWPGETPFEICVGAILTQNTNWTNVEKAIENLKKAKALDLRVVKQLSNADLAELIRPAGYYNLKAARLKSFVGAIDRDFDLKLEKLLILPTERLRETLLEINGIGPETADSIILYAAQQSSFVVDAYTKRIFSRHHWIQENASYDEVKSLCEQNLAVPPRDQSLLDYWQDYHAQLVAIGKDYCRPRSPRCQECPLQPLLQEPA